MRIGGRMHVGGQRMHMGEHILSSSCHPHLARVLKLLGVGVKVQDATVLRVKVEVVRLCMLQQQLPCSNRELHSVNRVGTIVGDLTQELCHPAILVPADISQRVHQQRRVLLEHPLDPLQDRARGVPHLGVRGRELAAVGKARLHSGIPVAIIDRHVETALHQRTRGRDARDTSANHRHLFHWAPAGIGREAPG